MACDAGDSPGPGDQNPPDVREEIREWATSASACPVGGTRSSPHQCSPLVLSRRPAPPRKCQGGKEGGGNRGVGEDGKIELWGSPGVRASLAERNSPSWPVPPTPPLAEEGAEEAGRQTLPTGLRARIGSSSGKPVAPGAVGTGGGVGSSDPRSPGDAKLKEPGSSRATWDGPSATGPSQDRPHPCHPCPLAAHRTHG